MPKCALPFNKICPEHETTDEVFLYHRVQVSAMPSIPFSGFSFSCEEEMEWFTLRWVDGIVEAMMERSLKYVNEWEGSFRLQKGPIATFKGINFCGGAHLCRTIQTGGPTPL